MCPAWSCVLPQAGSKVARLPDVPTPLAIAEEIDAGYGWDVATSARRPRRGQQAIQERPHQGPDVVWVLPRWPGGHTSYNLSTSPSLRSGVYSRPSATIGQSC